jgi:hypothetical protein
MPCEGRTKYPIHNCPSNIPVVNIRPIPVSLVRPLPSPQSQCWSSRPDAARCDSATLVPQRRPPSIRADLPIDLTTAARIHFGAVVHGSTAMKVPLFMALGSPRKVGNGPPVAVVSCPEIAPPAQSASPPSISALSRPHRDQYPPSPLSFREADRPERVMLDCSWCVAFSPWAMRAPPYDHDFAVTWACSDGGQAEGNHISFSPAETMRQRKAGPYQRAYTERQPATPSCWLRSALGPSSGTKHRRGEKTIIKSIGEARSPS